MIDYKIVIPARYASTRFPGKPLAEIQGKTMLQWTYEAAQRSQASDIYIATDDGRIQTSALGYTEKVIMTSDQHKNGTERLSEVSEKLAWDSNTIVVNVQGDEPLIKAKHIDLVAQTLSESADAGIATLCYPITEVSDLFDPNIVKVVRDANNMAHYFSRAPIPWNRDSFKNLINSPEPRVNSLEPQVNSPEQQNISISGHYRHIGLYAYRSGLLGKLKDLAVTENEIIESLEQLRALHYGIKIAVAQCDEVPGIGVDVKGDLHLVEQILSNQKDG